MSVVIRGVKNTFRNGIRTSSIVLILAISVGLALSMLLANQAVTARIDDLKSRVGTTLQVRPAGSANMQGGGEPLKTADAEQVGSVPHVAAVSSILNFTLQTTGSDTVDKGMVISGGRSGETNLQSSIDAGSLGKRFQGEESAAPNDIKLPVRSAGISSNKGEDGKTINITEGRELQANDTQVALVGKDLAEKNNLKLNSTFTAFDKTFTVVGIFDTGTKFANDGIYIPLTTAQNLTQSGDEISAISVQVDSIDHVDATLSAIKSKLGDDKADVTSAEENSMEAVNSLKSVEQISIVGFVIALGAAAVVIFFSMLMIVRERRREIGVLKAIGGSNRVIVTQFIVEAMVLVMMGAIVGMGLATVSGNGIATALVSTNASQAEEADSGPGLQGKGGGLRTFKLGGPVQSAESAKDLVGNITTTIGAGTLAIGLLAALGIAIVGSAVPAWLIAKVRPAEVLRGE